MSAFKIDPQELYPGCFCKYLPIECIDTIFPIWKPNLQHMHCSDCYSVLSLQGRCSRENCKYLHPPPHLKTQLEINGRNNLIQQKNMAMLAQQMQLANAMMPGTQLPPMVRGHTRMNTPQLLPTVRPHTHKSSHMCYKSNVTPGRHDGPDDSMKLQTRQSVPASPWRGCVDPLC